MTRQVPRRGCPNTDIDYAQMDPGIVLAVRTLRRAGVRTVWSCEGGTGHPHPLPTITFKGDVTEAQRVIRIAREARLGPRALRRLWELQQAGAEPQEGDDSVGTWEVEFSNKFTIDATQAAAHASWMKSFKRDSTTQDPRLVLFQRLLELEPDLRALLARVQAGTINMNDLWLTTFCYLLEPIVGLNRQKDNDPILSSREAFDAALVGLYYSTPRTP